MPHYSCLIDLDVRPVLLTFHNSKIPHGFLILVTNRYGSLLPPVTGERATRKVMNSVYRAADDVWRPELCR